MLRQNLDQRQPGYLVLGRDLAEDWRLVQLNADVKADAHQKDANQKRNAPGPEQEIRFRHLRHCSEYSNCCQVPDRPTDLNHRPEKSAISILRILDDHQHRSAPLTTDPDTLKQSKEDEQNWRYDADLIVGRQQADEEGANPHDDDRHHEHGFATGAVAKVSENRSA